MRLQRSPNCDRRHEIVESHDRWMSLQLHSKRNDHHREQKLPGEKVELCGDRESSQIY
jgi:hypothetical protein